ncbi:hypothetical protein Hanom_Chr17g01575511 [Helianthus anomalus]
MLSLTVKISWTNIIFLEVVVVRNLKQICLGISKVSLGDGVVGNGWAQYNIANGVETVAGEHPYVEHPSRTLFVSNIKFNAEGDFVRVFFFFFIVAETI